MPRYNKIGYVLNTDRYWMEIVCHFTQMSKGSFVTTAKRPLTPVTCLDLDLKLDRGGDKYVCYQTRYTGPDIFLPVI